MSFRITLYALGAALVTASGPIHRALPVVQPNSNTESAGVLRGGVLTVTLEAKESQWRSDGLAGRPIILETFSEPGKPPLVPGPLLRVPAGTEIHLFVRNGLSVPLTFFVPAALSGGRGHAVTGTDSVVIAPGSGGQITARAAAPGNYVYRATTPAGVNRVTQLTGALGGALVVDSAGAPVHPKDRIFVIMATPDSAAANKIGSGHSRGFGTGGPNGFQGIAFTINGRSWPNTERIFAAVGDSLHWRVINASAEPHPMHLHGFYYRVDAFDGPDSAELGRPSPGQMVVTQLLLPWTGMSMTWSPDQPGNWIFHCHFALHAMPQSMPATPNDAEMRDMAGLVLGVDVADRPGVHAAGDPLPSRHLRLVAVVDSSVKIQIMEATGYTPEPSMRFVLDEDGRRVDTRRAFGPELDLTRGEPVSITIVNHLPEATSVHWHGIEIQDSYMDGVPGASGEGTRLTPAIAPGDSFEARFTPPRSGTFMYHAHVDEPREEQAGLEGALIVRDPNAPLSLDDHVFFFKGGGINGDANPDTIVFHVGQPARLRLLNLANWEVDAIFSLTARPDSALQLGADTMLVRWRPIAKDGFDLPTSQQLPRVARQLVSMGETYDFEYLPKQPGALRLELRQNGPHHRLLFRVPVRVE